MYYSKVACPLAGSSQDHVAKNAKQITGGGEGVRTRRQHDEGFRDYFSIEKKDILCALFDLLL